MGQKAVRDDDGAYAAGPQAQQDALEKGAVDILGGNWKTAGIVNHFPVPKGLAAKGGISQNKIIGTFSDFNRDPPIQNLDHSMGLVIKADQQICSISKMSVPFQSQDVAGVGQIFFVHLF